jgi:glycerol 3-phosphatase-2
VSGFGSTSRSLLEEYDGLLVDLDGVVLLDEAPVRGAVDALAAARAAAVPIAFVTNNAARTPAQIVARLRAAGVEATEPEVVTSSMAAAAMLAERHAAGAPVLVIGGEGLADAVATAGLRPVRTAADGPVAVVQGWGPDVCWADLAEGAVALLGSVPWLVTNLDRTLPSPRGPLPGSGALIAALVTATGREPDLVAGKPGPELFRTAASLLGARHPLVIGDRLDTDIAGGVAAGLDSLLVMTGVSGPADLLAAAAEQRPTYVGADLGAVRQPQPAVALDGRVARCGSATVTDAGEVVGNGPAVDVLRAAAELAWAGRLDAAAISAVVAALPS